MIVRIRQIVALVFLIVVLSIALHQKVFADEYASNKLSISEQIKALERQKREVPIIQLSVLLMFQAKIAFIFHGLAYLFVMHHPHFSYKNYVQRVFYILSIFMIFLQFFFHFRFMSFRFMSFQKNKKILAIQNSRPFQDSFSQIYRIYDVTPLFIAELPAIVIIKKLVFWLVAIVPEAFSLGKSYTGGRYDG